MPFKKTKKKKREKFASLLLSPLMIVPPLGEAEEEDDYSDYFHFFSIAEQKKLKLKKNLGLGWQREYLTPDDAVCIGSTHGWLVFLHPLNSYLYLYNPFVTQNSSQNLPYIPLPSLETIENVKAMRVLKSDNLSPSTSLIRDFLKIDRQNKEFNWPPSQNVDIHAIQDVVLSSSPPSSLDNGDCTTTTTTTTAVMNSCGSLFFCKLGVDERWTHLNHQLYRTCCDHMYFSQDGRFYALNEDRYDRYHELEAWDLSDHSYPIHQVIDPDPDPTFSGIDSVSSNGLCLVRYLVESSGDLLLVFRFFATEDVPEEDQLEDQSEDYPYFRPRFHRTMNFVVYRLNFNLNRWESVDCLNDRALFVGYNPSFSLSTRDYPELRENSIYFTENYEEIALQCNTGHDNGVFHLEDNSVTYFRTRDWKRIEPHALKVPSPVWVCVAQNNAS